MPTEKQIKSFIEYIPKQLSKLNYKEITGLCNYYLSTLPFPILEFTNEKFYFDQYNYGGLNLLYRARHITNSQNKPHQYVSDISFIPVKQKHKIKQFGRINKPQESMFYGSINFPTACVEAVSKGNIFEHTNSTMLTVGIWSFDSPLKLVEIPHSIKYFEKFYDEVNFKSEKIQLEHIRNNNERLRKKINNDLEFEKLMFIADEFAKWDTQENSEYMISNYFADRVFDRLPGFKIDHKVDGIIYPSTSFSYQEKNIVLKPEVVQNKMSFISAMQIWMIFDLKSGKGGQFIPIKQSIKADKNGKLKWN